MRRRLTSAVLAALMSGSLAIAPASSQDAPFTIDPTAGLPGDTVTAQLDPAVVTGEGGACIDDVAELQALLPGIASAITAEAASASPPLSADESVTASALNLIFTVLAGDPRAEQLLENLFVLTFADIGTMEPVGSNSNFDPLTGEGTIVVPAELTPGLWAVVASCVIPDVTDDAAFREMIEAATVVFQDYFEGDAPLDGIAILLALLGDPTLGQTVLEAALPPVMVPQDGARWTATFTVPAELPAPDPATAAFCAALPELPALGEDLMATLAALPADDGTMPPEEWAAAADWDGIGDELEGLVEEIEALLAEGDTYRPDELADDWATATAPLRQVRDALQAVDFDLSSESGRMIAGELRTAATAEGEDPAGDAATAALTDWFVASCIPAAPATPAAPAAQAAAAQPRYTG